MKPGVWWFIQRVTGGALLVLLVMHFWVEHFANAQLLHGELTYETIRARITQPAWQAIDIAFLLIALLHGLNGARGIILDYGRVGPRGARAATVGLVALGAVWAWWGIAAFQHLR